MGRQGDDEDARGQGPCEGHSCCCRDRSKHDDRADDRGCCDDGCRCGEDSGNANGSITGEGRTYTCGCSQRPDADACVRCGCTHRCTCQPVGRRWCPPPQAPAPTGTVDLPQHKPPYQPGHADVPPWAQGRPAQGDDGDIPWFRAKVGEIRRKGPVFGPRKDEFLPFLLMRADATDRGARPHVGVFWESPDIYVVPNQPAETAPLRPVVLGGTAQASVPNTLYAHVWNIGKAPAFGVRVEFWWFDPSLGFSRGAGHLLGAASVDLGDRFTLYEDWREEGSGSRRWLGRGCHAIVACPASWIPTYVNGGHECLVVRVGDSVFDPVGVQQFSPASDRHVGQRNIAVVPAASPAELTLGLDLGWYARPGDVTVDVTADPPGSMAWLQLYAGNRVPGYRVPAAAVSAGLLTPTPAGVRHPDLEALAPDAKGQLLRRDQRFHRGCDPLTIAVHAAVQDLDDGEAQVLRVRQRIDGEVVGGYTIVLVGRSR